MISQNIQPITKTLYTMNILQVNVNLDNSARIVAEITNSVDTTISYNLYMDSEAYAQWGDSDEYVVNWVMSQLGVEPA
jgi:spore coat protein U-like protein